MSRLVSVEGDEIVIRVSLDAIPTAAVLAFDAALGFGNHTLRVEDARKFGAALAEALAYAVVPYSDSTLIDVALDAACLHVLESGGGKAEGLAGDA